MAKIPFTLEAWLADRSQRVETRDGRPARIICTDAKADDGACVIALITDDGGEEAYQFFPDGRAFSSKSSIEDCADLFLITPEPELSEFEEALKDCVNVRNPENPMTDEGARNNATILLAIAFKEFKENEASHIKEFVDQKEKEAYERGKAEALKDLPRWRKWGNGASGNPDGRPIALVARCGGIRLVSCLGTTGEKYIFLADLKKLPGFKEDEI